MTKLLDLKQITNSVTLNSIAFSLTFLTKRHKKEKEKIFIISNQN